MTHSVFALPVRPRPIDGELSIGYLCRVAMVNGYEDMRVLCRAISDKGISIVGALRLDSHEIGRLFGPLPRFCISGLPTTSDITVEHFNHHYLRWCPACLRGRGYFSGAWGLKLCCVCVQHRVRLVENCPSCQERQRILRCTPCCSLCGQDLSRASAQAVGNALVELHRRLQASIETCRRTGNPDGVLDWLRLVKYLGPFLADPWCRRPGQVVGLHRLPEAMTLVEAAARLLDDWPTNFNALLHRARSYQPHATHLAQAFGPLYRVLYQDLAGESFDPLREAFERHLHEHWFGLLGRRNRWLRSDTISRHPRQTTKAVAREAGVGAAAVRHLERSGAITVHAVQHASGRVTRAVPVSEAERVERLKQDSVTLRHAASLLRIGRQRVRELIDAGLVRAWIDRRQTRAATWWLSKADVVCLASIGEPVGKTGRGQGWIDVVSVLKAWRLIHGEFALMVRALLASELRARRPAGHLSGLGDAELPISELRRWLWSHREAHQVWLSVDNAATRLGLKQQVTYELVARGLIATSLRKGSRFIHRDAVGDFQKTYVSLAELASSQSMAPRRLLAQLHCEPVCGPRIDGARQYFYRRDEASHALEVLHSKGCS